MLSIVSIVTFIVSKIAVGIFAGGVVFGTLFPEVHLHVGGLDIDSFWIGSVLVIVLTGLYTMLGGMRAVAYNDAVQVIVLIGGSALLTFYGLAKLGGWGELRHICGSDMFNLWKPLIPAGQTGTWAPVIVKDAAGQIVKQAWYFNDNFPWLGMLFCAPIIGLWYWCTDQYIVQRALGAPNETIARRGSIFAAFLKLFPVYLFIIPGLICLRAGQERQGSRNWQPMIGPDGKAIASVAQGAFPDDGRVPAAARTARHRGGRPALGADGFARRRVQRLLHAVHGGPVSEVEAEPPSQHQIVRIGRIATAVMVLIALAWIPVIKGASRASTTTCSRCRATWRRRSSWCSSSASSGNASTRRALLGHGVGFALGIFRMCVDTPVTLGLAGLKDGYTPKARSSGSSTTSTSSTSAC